MISKFTVGRSAQWRNLMYLRQIAESRFKTRLMRAYAGNGLSDQQGLFGIADEFGVDLDTAANYL